MAWDTLKHSLLTELAQFIDVRAEHDDRESLHRLSNVFYQHFPAEDMRDRSVENLYGCLYGLLRFMRAWPDRQAKVRIFNPEIQSHGWESKSTCLVILCRGVPFTTASVRGELNRRHIPIHTIASCNLAVSRDPDGAMTGVKESEEAGAGGAEDEALLFFEIGRHSDVRELEDLRTTVESILAEVAVVVDDFQPLCNRLHAAAADIRATSCVEPDYRDEAEAFLDWLEQDHMTLLGYEYLVVKRRGSKTEIKLDKKKSLGLLRGRKTRGLDDLAADLKRLQPEELRHAQLSFSKSRTRSRVHRLAYPDYVAIKVFDDNGEVVGQHRFIGLYTSVVYTMASGQIPILRRKVQKVMAMSHLEKEEHEGRELQHVLEVFPRDELFQSSSEELFATVTAVNRIQERRQTRLFVRPDVHGKFVNCIVYIPRDRYTTEQREKIQQILTDGFAAQEAEFTTFFSESILVRCHFVLKVDINRPLVFDVNELEGQIVQATLAWGDRLALRLVEEFGEERGEQYMRQMGRGFPPGYRDDFDPRIGVVDIKRFLRLVAGEELSISLYRQVEEANDMLRMRLYHRSNSLPLSDVLPILENLGLRVVSERPYGVRVHDAGMFWVQEFTLVYSLSHDIAIEEVREEFEDAFSRIWFGEAESDSFNRLLLGTRLNWREIALLRAIARYLKQIRFPYSLDLIAQTMANHLTVTATILELFLTRFSPVFDGDEDWRAQRELVMEERILEALDQVENLGEDRIIRQFLHVIKAMQRTNFFQEGEQGGLKSHISFKLSPRGIPGVPEPVPLYEIYVYSPRVEGVHLRGGKVARGGLRWSDRHEDYRTEVLGLVKAQQVKNAVIVPVGAKGGFVPRQMRPQMSRDEIQQEGIACYKIFIRGLLDLTDNLAEGGVVRPQHVVAKDDDDPYLVVAADKGTATFSDIANSISAEYDFWLGDAFASGGSAGYDHKKMGITARGAWVSVEHHFREMGVDTQTSDFTVVGIGDMSGDVFGNGMLLSEHIRLVAAFNHMHIFLDPEPDAAASFGERRRLFQQPRTGWNDYNEELISDGGGVFPRSAKSIKLSPQVKARFEIEEDTLTPNELISRLLCAPVDLLWNGGIGTYIKASTESHMDVGDKTNDAVRVDASDLRCKIIGEGGNLGVTQLGRVQYSLAGGRMNTDFVDNSAGVDCSDHEVNIKILLNEVVARGDMTEKQRNVLLEEMTESVGQLVLHNNYHQVRAISLTEFQAIDRAGEYQNFIDDMEADGHLNRRLEFLPSDDELIERRAAGKGLTRPELSVLVSYKKGLLKEQLIDSSMGEDPYLIRAVNGAFPDKLLRLFPEDIQQHRLYREIMATQIANDVVNRMGLNFMLRQHKATGASPVDVARAYTTVTEVYQLGEVWDEIESLDHQVASSVQMEMMLNLIRLVKRATRWLLRNRRRHLAPTDSVAEFGAGVKALRESLSSMLRGRAAEQYETQFEHFVTADVPKGLAEFVAGANHAYTSFGIVQAAAETNAPLLDVAKLYYLIGERLELDWFGGLILSTKVLNEWQAWARDTYLEDLEWQQRTLAVGALRHMCEDRNFLKCVEEWERQEADLLERWRAMLRQLHAIATPDFSMFAVANRELLDLAQSSRRQDV